MAAPEQNPVGTRDWPRTIAFAVLTLVSVYLCYCLIEPFLPALVWSISLTIVGLPMHRAISRVVGRPNLSAGITTLTVLMVIGLPTVWVTARLVREGSGVMQIVRQETRDGKWRDYARQVPLGGTEIANLPAEEIESRVNQGVDLLAARSLGAVEGMAGWFLQLLVATFALFFFFRDRHQLLAQLRGWIPLAAGAADEVIQRAEDAVHATVYGTLLTSLLQGVTAGLLFWALGIDAAVVWAVIIFVLGVLPVLGAFLVWVPFAIYLASQDRWAGALILVVWGLMMAGPVTNFVYAYAAGGRMRMHPLPTLLSFVGGLYLFGISGMVLGPAILCVTVSLLEFWRDRAADGTPRATKTAAPLESGNGARILEVT